MSFATKSTHHANYDDANASVMLIHVDHIDLSLQIDSINSWTLLRPLRPCLSKRTRYSARYAAFEAAEDLQFATANPYEALSNDSEVFSVDNQKPSEIERLLPALEFSGSKDNISKRERNKNSPAERSIKTTEHYIKTALNNAELLVEFWYKAAKAQAYTRAKLRRGLKIMEDVINEVTRQPFRNAALRNKESKRAEATSPPKSTSLITETKLIEDLDNKPKGPTPFGQDHQVAQVTSTKTIGTKRKADKELLNAFKTSVQPRQSWNLPGIKLDKRASDTLDPGKRYARTSTFQTSLITRKRKSLLLTENEKAIMAIFD
ncbi:hypothetical protein MBM_08930 [Drepanopeziza brunnea f. sp. 'multigermtubi' MB_m1]|uniref:Uncharacterized protein n=1 Tax=Marssonina brunnea f. sp. multigermtubi (strain MB_m1) TaxID=1072389 RepID=K1WJE1_MARBU|nr:uncharacterized protein MBM_08930 [Drepanopeziza brunnea f. sp. 'multigermtubi' MB_m1]EKD12976.1 hypothetical protein MBM_08930 [Drepanopeziza brunnea f. sp. 'multigermtubi' MB_m1]